eukprot:43629-Eustigmatos_ZCMA.PRE.1
MSEDDVKRQLEVGHVCWDDHDMVDGASPLLQWKLDLNVLMPCGMLCAVCSTGRPTGAIRASLGYMSTWQDVAVLLAFLRKYFVSREQRRASVPSESLAQVSNPR